MALSTALAKTFTAVTLPFTTFTLSADEQNLTFTDAGTAWTCSLSAYSCAKSAGAAAAGRTRSRRRALAAEVAAPGGGAGRAGRGGRAGGPPGSSTDGAFIASIKDNNVCVRPAAAAADACDVLTRRGTADKPYTLNGLLWSPDSKKIFASRLVKNGDRRMVRYVESSPADQVQPKTFERFYAKPGDALDETERVLIDVAGKREILVDNALFPNPYEITRIQWRRDSRAVTFEYNQRGHQLYRVIEVDGRHRRRADAHRRADRHVHPLRARDG